MAVVTRERFSELISKLTLAYDELRVRERGEATASAALGDGIEELRQLVQQDDLDAAEQRATALWRDLLESPLIMGVFRGTRAPDAEPESPDHDPSGSGSGLEQTAEAIETFNEVVRKIGGLTR